MTLAKQKDFYDTKRQFQGRDQPTDSHPEPSVAPPDRTVFVVGIGFFLFVALTFALKVYWAQKELSPSLKAPPAKTIPAAPK